MNYLPDAVKFKQILLEKYSVAQIQYLSKELVESSNVEFVYDWSSDMWIERIITFLYRNKLREDTKLLEVPASWWDMLKRDWFPHFILKWFPIRYSSIVVGTAYYKICPHIEIGFKENKWVHLSWLDNPEWKGADDEGIGDNIDDDHDVC